MAERRFIAGAVCPACRALDRIVVEVIEGVPRQRCVACGFERADLPGSTPPPGRLQSAPGGARASSEHAVRIVERSPDPSEDPPAR